MAYDSRNRMWLEACEFIERAERLHRQFFQPDPRGRVPAWEPPVDLLETGDELSIIAALPGVGPDQIEILIENDALIITGVRQLSVTSRSVIHRLEIPHGRFERRIMLPRGRFELSRREVVNGCLLLALRRL